MPMPMIRLRCLAFSVALGCIALVASTSVHADIDPADRAALDKAAASVRWMNEFNCPSLGLPPNVKGMQTETETRAQQESSWAFAQGRLDALRAPLAQREAVLRNAKRTDNYDAELARLDAQLTATLARAGTALVNWSLANWIELAKVDASYPYPPQGAHPLDRFLQREARLREFVQAAGRLPGAADYLLPVAAKFRSCLLVMQNQIVERNADSIRIAMNATTRSADVAPIGRSYGVVEASFSGPGVVVPEVITALQAHGDVLKERERVAAEAEAKRLAELARIEEAKRPAARPSPSAPEPKTDLQAQLRTASSLVQALVNRSVGDALRFMHADISLSSPLGRAQGKNQVSSALQQGFASGRGGNIGQPQISGGQVVASVQSARGAGTMYFQFQDGLVSSLQIR